MSGICAIWGNDHTARVAETLVSAVRGLSGHVNDRVDRLMDVSAGVAVAARFSTQQIFSNSRLLIACDADLYNENELKGGAGDGSEVPENARTAALLAALYERFGSSFVE